MFEKKQMEQNFFQKRLKDNLYITVSLLLLVVVHISWLLKAELYITPELIFPVWLLSNAKTFVSEINSFYPPTLFYLISSLNNLIGNLRTSVVLVQLTIVLVTDLILFYYLVNKFNFKIAIAGLIFYIPWQVFFRGNYLWFDIATIPFLAFSFFHFCDYITDLRLRNLFLASVFLALGYLFKNTVLWIYPVFLIWLMYFIITKKNSKKEFLRNILFLFCPLLLIAVTNMLILLIKGSFEFTFFWHAIMQNFIYPRMSTLPRPIQSNYFLPLGFVISIYLTSCLFVEKYSNLSRSQRYFLYIFPLVSLANIFPRWSDFHVQPFVFFLTIIFAYGLYLRNGLKKSSKTLFNTFLGTTVFFLSLIIANRIATEINTKNLPPDYVSKYAPYKLEELVKNKSIFAYDFALYNGPPIQSTSQSDFYEKFKLALGDPDKYYRSLNSQIALNYTKSRNPDLVIVPYNIHKRLVSGTDLTSFEMLVAEKYLKKTEIDKIYFIYTRRLESLE